MSINYAGQEASTNYDQVEEPWTQKVRRAMHRFSSLVENGGMNLTVEASTAYNELGAVLSGFINAFDSECKQSWERQQRIDQLERQQRYDLKIIQRQRMQLNDMANEIVKAEIEHEDAMDNAQKAASRFFQDERHQTKAYRKAFESIESEIREKGRQTKEYRTAYESIASQLAEREEELKGLRSQTHTYEAEIAELKNGLVLAEERARILEQRIQDNEGGYAERFRSKMKTIDQTALEQVKAVASDIAKAQQPLDKCPHCTSTVGYCTTNDGIKRCQSCMLPWAEFKKQASPPDPTADSQS